MNTLSLILFVLFAVNSKAQDNKEVLSKIDIPAVKSFIPPGYEILDTCSGDINKDGYFDLVLVLKDLDKDTLTDERRLLIVLLNDGTTYKEISRSKKAILSKDEGGIFGDPYAGIKIKNGVLIVDHYGGSSWRWAYTHKFRYENGDVYLIGTTYDSYWVNGDCGDNDGVGDSARNFEDINWVTGEKEIIKRDEHCKLIQHTKTRFKPKSLVSLNDFNFDN